MTTGDRTPRTTSARGRRRRELLLEAAGEVLMSQGFAAVSHRSVAQQAGLPLSATTYYFGSLDHLLEDVVRHLAAGWLEQVHVALAAMPTRLRSAHEMAEALVRVAALAPTGTTSDDLGTLLSFYERYLEAARHPLLRPIVAEYDRRLDDALAELLQRRDAPPSSSPAWSASAAPMVLAAVDGAVLRALAEGRPLESAITTVEHLLAALWTAEPAP